jgi:hypothetical protein
MYEMNIDSNKWTGFAILAQALDFVAPAFHDTQMQLKSRAVVFVGEQVEVIVCGKALH